MLKKIFGLILLLTIVFSSVSCAPKTAEVTGQTTEVPEQTTKVAEQTTTASDVIKIGLIDHMTGGEAAYGLAAIDAYNLALETYPEVLGRKIELIRADTKSDKAESSLAAENVISQGVVAILGTTSSGMSIAVNEVAFKKGIPVVSNISTNPLVTQGKSNAFRVCFIDPFQGKVLAKFAYENLKAKTAVLLVDISSDYSVGVSNYFSSGWSTITGDAKTLLGNFSIMGGDKDFTAQLTSIKSLNPDVIVAPDNYSEVGLIIKQAREMGLTQPILGADATDFPEIEQIAGDAIKNDYYLTTHWSPDAFKDSPKSQEFLKLFQDRYGRMPDVNAVTAWDAYLVLIDAISRAKSTNPADIIASLKATKDFQGITGVINFDENGDALKPVIILGYKDGLKQYITSIK